MSAEACSIKMEEGERAANEPQPDTVTNPVDSPPPEGDGSEVIATKRPKIF